MIAIKKVILYRSQLSGSSFYKSYSQSTKIEILFSSKMGINDALLSARMGSFK